MRMTERCRRTRDALTPDQISPTSPDIDPAPDSQLFYYLLRFGNSVDPSLRCGDIITSGDTVFVVDLVLRLSQA